MTTFAYILLAALVWIVLIVVALVWLRRAFRETDKMFRALSDEECAPIELSVSELNHIGLGSEATCSTHRKQ